MAISATDLAETRVLPRTLAGATVLADRAVAAR